jgi:hypothetical protein
MGNVLRRPALALAIAAFLFGIAAPVASANPGDLISTVVAPIAAGGSDSIASDGQVLYYTNPGDPTIHRVTIQGVPLPDIMVVGLEDFDGIGALSYDITRNMFWAVDDGTSGLGRHVYLIDRGDPIATAVLQFIIPDSSLAPDECQSLFCHPKVDGLAYDAQGDTLWYSPDESRTIYHFDTNGTPLGYYRTNVPGQSFTPDCPTDFSSGIAVGDHGGPSSTSSPTAIMYDFSRDCPSWFKYQGTNDITPVKQAVYPTYNGMAPEDDECGNAAGSSVPVVWVRDENDSVLRAFQVPTCFIGGGTQLQDKSRMTGGGGLPIIYPVTDIGQSAHHGFMIHCDATVQPDRLEVTWPNGNSFHLTSIVTSSTVSYCGNDLTSPGPTGLGAPDIQGVGAGRLNGQPGATVKWSFTDAGEPGTLDKGDITVTVPIPVGGSCDNPDPLDKTQCIVMEARGYLTGGPLLGEGNYQFHQGA